jgi:hypothetical protein
MGNNDEETAGVLTNSYVLQMKCMCEYYRFNLYPK